MKISKTKGTLNIFTWPSYKILNIQSSRVWLSRITSHNIKPNSIHAHIRLSIIKHYNFPFPVSSFSKTRPFSAFLVQVNYPFHTLYQLKPFLLSIYRQYLAVHRMNFLKNPSKKFHIKIFRGFLTHHYSLKNSHKFPY